MLLKVNNLNFKYKKEYVLKDISFKLNSGEILALLGANGAGKSTLLKCINKILHPLSGTIKLNEQTIESMNRNSIARNISYVPQVQEYESISVFETVLLGRKPYIKWDLEHKDMEIARRVIEQLKLTKLAMRNILELSGGEIQKVSIARALTQQPHLLLLDEPTSNLDQKNQLDILDLVHSSVKDNNIAAIISVHDLNMALRYADKFLLLKHNKVYDCVKKNEITPVMIKDVYDIDIIITEVNGFKLIIPK